MRLFKRKNSFARIATIVGSIQLVSAGIAVIASVIIAIVGIIDGSFLSEELIFSVSFLGGAVFVGLIGVFFLCYGEQIELTAKIAFHDKESRKTDEIYETENQIDEIPEI